MNPPTKRTFPAPTDAQRCQAKSKSTGKQCARYALQGLSVCRVHGGASAAARQAGQRRVVAAEHARKIEAHAAAVLAHEGLEPVKDPLYELGKLANASLEMVNALGARVNALDTLELLDDKSATQARVEAEMYERAIDRTHRFLDSLVKHGYTERQIKIAETEAALVAGVLRRVLSGLGLSREQLAEAQRLLSEEFRQMKPVQMRSVEA